MPPTHSGGEDSVRLLLTQNPARSFSSPGASYTVSHLNGSHSPDRQLAQYRAPPIVLTPAFLKRWGSLLEWLRLWFTYIVTSDEQTRPESEPRPSAHGVNPVSLG